MKRTVNIVIDIFFLALIVAVIVIGTRYLKKDDQTETKRCRTQILEKDTEISALYFDGDSVYVGTNGGLHVYDAATRILTQSVDDIRTVYTASIIGDGAGGIWIGHEEGLTHIDRNGDRTLFSDPDIPKGRVNTVAKVGDDILCGTYNGAARLTEENGVWTVQEILTKENGLICDSVNVILPVRDGILFCSYLDEAGGITYFSDSGTITTIDTKSGLPHPYITSAIAEDSGIIWIGTGFMKDGGLARLKPSGDGYAVDETFTKADGLPGEKVRSLFADEETFWVTTEYDGILIRRKAEGEIRMDAPAIYLTEESGLSDNEIKCIIATDDSYWLGGKYGLTVINKEDLRGYENE